MESVGVAVSMLLADALELDDVEPVLSIDELGVPVALELGVSVFNDDGIPVLLLLGVSVFDELGVPL